MLPNEHLLIGIEITTNAVAHFVSVRKCRAKELIFLHFEFVVGTRMNRLRRYRIHITKGLSERQVDFQSIYEFN